MAAKKIFFMKNFFKQILPILLNAKQFCLMLSHLLGAKQVLSNKRTQFFCDFFFLQILPILSHLLNAKQTFSAKQVSRLCLAPSNRVKHQAES